MPKYNFDAKGDAFLPNPGAINQWADSRTLARIFLGLKRGAKPTEYGEFGDLIDPEKVIEFVTMIRAHQLNMDGLPGGASFVAQEGFFTDAENKSFHGQEHSLQIVVYPEEGLPDFNFNMKVLTAVLGQAFDQKQVILDLEVEGNLWIGAFDNSVYVPPQERGEDDDHYRERILVIEKADETIELWDEGKLELPK